MSFHFTQICAFLTYSFRFMGYYSCFYRCKNRQFFKSKRFLAYFLPQITAKAFPAANLSGSPWQRRSQKKVLHRIEKAVEKHRFILQLSKKLYLCSVRLSSEGANHLLLQQYSSWTILTPI